MASNSFNSNINTNNILLKVISLFHPLHEKKSDNINKLIIVECQ